MLELLGLMEYICLWTERRMQRIKIIPFSLLKISEMNIYNGAGQCNVMVNPEDIVGSAYHYDDIEGMAIKADNQSYYAIFSLWNDGEIDVNKCSVLPKEHKKNMKVVKVVNPMSEIEL